MTSVQKLRISMCITSPRVLYPYGYASSFISNIILSCRVAVGLFSRTNSTEVLHLLV